MYRVPLRNSVTVSASPSPRAWASLTEVRISSESSASCDRAEPQARVHRRGRGRSRSPRWPLAAPPRTLRPRPSSPKNAYTLLRLVRTNGSAVSAPASRTRSRCRVDSTVQASSSQRYSAIQLANHSQRASSGASTVSRPNAASASFRIGAPAAYPSVNRTANPWRRRSDGPGACGGGGPASAASLISVTPPPRSSRPANIAADRASR